MVSMPTKEIGVAGQIVEKFFANCDGKKAEIVFRFPLLSDAAEATQFINDLRDEADFISQRQHETISSEKRFLAKQIKGIKDGSMIFLFVLADGKIIGSARLHQDKNDGSAHVACFGIGLREKFTGLGIGSRLLEKMLELAKKETAFKIIESLYLEPNRRSAELHKKFGFKKCGLFPKRAKLKDGKYCGQVILYKEIGRV